MRKHISKLMLVLVLLVQMMVSAVAFAEYNADMERFYGIWGVPNSGTVMEITPDTIDGKYYTIVDAADDGRFAVANLSLNETNINIGTIDGVNMRLTVNDGRTQTFHKYYRGNDGKLYPY